jgi:hypothetical protein
MTSLRPREDSRVDRTKNLRGNQACIGVRFTDDTPAATASGLKRDDKLHPPSAAIFRLAGAIAPFDS